jgi:hypothetical protein
VDRTFPSESASESAGSEALDGAGIIGDAIGTTIMRFITTTGTTPAAGRFTTGTLTTGVELRTADITSTATVGTGHRTPELAGAAKFSTVPAERPSHLKETTTLLEDTLHPRVRAARTPVHSVDTIMVEKPEVTRRVAAPASAAPMVAEGADSMAVAAVTAGVGITNRPFVLSRMDRKIQIWR